MNVKPRTQQRTLGLMGTGLVTFMQNQLWQGAMSAARENRVRLVFYPVISLSSIPPFDPRSKVLVDFIDAESLDGLLVWFAGMVEGIGVLRVSHFFDRYAALPLVTIGGRLKNFPDLSINNYQGARAAVEHLIEVHHRRHIGCIRGPIGHPDADERYRGYIEGLQAHDLRLNPDRVAQGAFEVQSNIAMAKDAIVRWLQNSRVEIDAVVTANDYMALAAIKAIESHGLRVPDDIAVVGFDDVDDSRANIPSLTTIRQPFFDLGRHATEMLLALLDGKSLPARSIAPAHLVTRESCGCTEKSLSLANIAFEDVSEPDSIALDSAHKGPPGDDVRLHPRNSPLDLHHQPD
jgi:LacI family transcriptional regulator